MGTGGAETHARLQYSGGKAVSNSTLADKEDLGDSECAVIAERHSCLHRPGPSPRLSKANASNSPSNPTGPTRLHALSVRVRLYLTAATDPCERDEFAVAEKSSTTHFCPSTLRYA